MNDKDTIFEASQVLQALASFAKRNPNVDVGYTEEELRVIAEKVMDVVRSLYKN